MVTQAKNHTHFMKKPHPFAFGEGDSLHDATTVLKHYKPPSTNAKSDSDLVP